MDLKVLATVFGIVFLAELGDKTQLATLLFASKSPGNLIAVFVGASAALVVASSIGVVAGGVISRTSRALRGISASRQSERRSPGVAHARASQCSFTRANTSSVSEAFAAKLNTANVTNVSNLCM